MIEGPLRPAWIRSAKGPLTPHFCVGHAIGSSPKHRLTPPLADQQHADDVYAHVKNTFLSVVPPYPINHTYFCIFDEASASLRAGACFKRRNKIMGGM